MHCQNSTAQPLKFENGWIVSFTFYDGCDYLSILKLLGSSSVKVLLSVNIASSWYPIAYNAFRPEKNTTILQMTFQIHFVAWKPLYFDSNLQKCVPGVPINKKPTLALINSWLPGDILHCTSREPNCKGIGSRHGYWFYACWAPLIACWLFIHSYIVHMSVPSGPDLNSSTQK